MSCQNHTDLSHKRYNVYMIMPWELSPYQEVLQWTNHLEPVMKSKEGRRGNEDYCSEENGVSIKSPHSLHMC